MGKGSRERRKRQGASYRTELKDVSTKKPSLDSEELALLGGIITRAFNRRGVVTGVVGVRSGKVDQDQVKQIVEDNPSAHVIALELKETGEA